MDISKEIRGHAAKKGVSISKIARDTGTTPQNLNRKLSSQSIKYREAHAIARYLGYEITWQDTERPQADNQPPVANQ